MNERTGQPMEKTLAWPPAPFLPADRAESLLGGRDKLGYYSSVHGPQEAGDK